MRSAAVVLSSYVEWLSDLMLHLYYCISNQFLTSGINKVFLPTQLDILYFTPLSINP